MLEESKKEDGWYCPQCESLVETTKFETCIECDFWGVYKVYYDESLFRYIKVT